MTKENLLLKIITCEEKQEKIYYGMIYHYESSGVKDLVSIYIFDINKKIDNIVFYNGQYSQFLNGKKTFKNLEFNNDCGVYCEFEIIT